MTALLSILLLAIVSFAAEADAILGKWKTEPTKNGFAIIEIEREGDSYSGSIAWLKNPNYKMSEDPSRVGQPKVDDKNPDESLRGRPILGMRMLEGFTFDGNSTWSGGTIYDPESGNTYKSKMKLTKNGELKVRGYVGISLFGRSTVWTRAADELNE